MDEIVNESVNEISKPSKVKRSYSRKQTKSENTIANLIPSYPDPVEEILGDFEQKKFNAEDAIERLKLQAKYNNYVKLFPEKNLDELNSKWDIEELQQRIKYVKTVSSMTLNTVSNVNIYLIEIVSKFVEICVKTLTKGKLNIDGLSVDLKNNKEINECIKLMIAEYIDFEVINDSKIRLSLIIGYLATRKAIENAIMPTDIDTKKINVNIDDIKSKFNNL